MPTRFGSTLLRALGIFIAVSVPSGCSSAETPSAVVAPAPATASPAATASSTTTPSPSVPSAAVAAKTVSCDSLPYQGDLSLNCNGSGPDFYATTPSGLEFSTAFALLVSNATITSPTLRTTYFSQTPTSFPVIGTAVAASQTVFSGSPAALNVVGASLFEFGIDYALPAGNLTFGEKFNCTLYDDTTIVGFATTVVSSQTFGGTTKDFVQCNAVYPTSTADLYYPPITLPATIRAGDVYTYIISR